MAHFIDDDKDLHIECHTTCALFASPSTDIDFILSSLMMLKEARQDFGSHIST